MEDGRKFQVTLTPAMAEAVDRKVASGEFSSAEDVVREGLEVFFERDSAFERWVREEVIPGHAEYMADPSTGVPLDQVLERIKARRAAREA